MQSNVGRSTYPIRCKSIYDLVNRKLTLVVVDICCVITRFSENVQKTFRYVILVLVKGFRLMFE